MEIIAYGSILLIAFLIYRDIIIPILKYFGLIASKDLNTAEIKNLSKYSPYYRQLKPAYKKEFRQRVAIFMKSKEFIPRKMAKVPEEMKIVVASFAIQLTFGLPVIYLAHFTRILIYPDDYYSTINKAYHKGEVNPRFGIIALSWSHLVHGIANEADGINLGLHEMAHAIHLENRISNEEYGFLDTKVWREYAELAHFEMQSIRKGHTSFFRSEAAIDHHEFFAVLIENFFERPSALKAYHSDLYEKTTLLLKQDPLLLLNL